MNLPPPVPASSPPPDRPIVRTRDINARLIGFAVVAILGLTFILQNRSRVRTHFLWMDFYTRVWVAMAVSMAVGVLADRLFVAWWRRRAHKETRS